MRYWISWDYFTEETVECVVVGYPMKLNDEESESMKYVSQFATAFHRKFPDIPLEYEDERIHFKNGSQGND